MAYPWTHDSVHTRQHRASTAPVPPRPPFSTIPPSLIPGRRHRQTFSAMTTAVNGIPYAAPGAGIHPMTKIPATFLPGSGIPGYHVVDPSPYGNFQPPPPPPLLPPQPQSPVPPRWQQPAGPPLPPKTLINTSPSVSPTVPPKPPPPLPPPPTLVRPKLSLRSQSQPPPLKPRVSSYSLPPPPPPPPPPRPQGARSSSVKVTSSTFVQPYATPSANPGPGISPSPSNKGSPDTHDTILPPTPSVTSTAGGHLGMNEEEELELVLELSAHTEREHTNSLLPQDEDLARALEQSLRDPPRRVYPRLQLGRSVVDGDGDNVATSPSMNPSDAHSHSSNQSSHAPSPLLAPSQADVQLKDDEAFARSLEAKYQSERTSSPTSERSHNADPSTSRLPLLPLYADVVNKEVAMERRESPAMAPSPVQRVSPSPAPADERLSVPDQASTPRTSPSPAQRSSPRPEALEIQTSPEEEEAPETPSPSPQSSRALMTPNQYVEPELLFGVSFGFNTPPAQDLEMRGPLPNIIALPYGKCPPMHIRAPSWRQLLKLMAKLSATQVEPSVEAVAVTKGELQLRTVIQFFKVHSNSSEWRTVIYLTIENPPPPEHRLTSVDVNALPYSYRLSTLPTLLRDGPESKISKYYTVPATARTPWPKLPISMPNLALYLTAALDDSRRALNDSSSGLRRLAKMIDQFYPNQESQVPVGEEEVRRRGGRALFGRLMGRSTRPQGGRNAEVYDLVTPFVPDEWG